MFNCITTSEVNWTLYLLGCNISVPSARLFLMLIVLEHVAPEIIPVMHWIIEGNSIANYN